MNKAGVLAAVLVLVMESAVTAAQAPPAPPRVPAPPAAPRSEPDEPAWLGLFLGDSPDGGVKVVAVADGGPAAKAGIREGDLVLSVNDRPVTDRRSLGRIVRRLRPGEKVTLETLRDGKAVMRVALAAPRVIELRIPDVDEAAAPELPGGETYFLSDWAAPGVLAAGATVAPIPPELRRHFGAPPDAGVLVTHVAPGGRASAAGIKVGDVIVRAGGDALHDAGDLYLRLLRGAESAPLPLEVVRGGKPLTVSLPARQRARPEAERAKRLAEIEAEMAAL